MRQDKKKGSNKRLDTILKEFGRRQAARQRLPMGIRLIAPLVFLGLTFGITGTIVFWADSFHHSLHPELPSLFSYHRTLGWIPILILLPPFFVGLSLSLLLSNLFFWLIVPIRKIMDENAKGVSGASFADAMKATEQVFFYLFFPSLLLTFLGIYAPWDR